jgi:DNA polymerase-3 subunit epsilon
MTKLVVIDTETTGLSMRSDRVVEIAVVGLSDDGQVEGSWTTLLNPGRDVGPTSIHGIRAGDVLQAPSFADVAGDLASLCRGRVIVGHNLTFDTMIIASEYARLGSGFAAPKEARLDTLHLAPRHLPSNGGNWKLETCCVRYGILNEHAHSALGDALATARLLQLIASAAGGFSGLEQLYGLSAMASRVKWPDTPLRNTPIVPRTATTARPKHYLERLSSGLPSIPGDDAEQEYLTLLDRVLLDREVSSRESDALVALASDLGIDQDSARSLNGRYLEAMASQAWADEVVTNDELSDLRLLGRLLGFHEAAVNQALEKARTAPVAVASVPAKFRLRHGDMLVFTGEMSRSREDLERAATQAGLIPHGGVTKQVKLVVAADPDSLSGKAKKAAQYGIPIVNEDAFWKMLVDGIQ